MLTAIEPYRGWRLGKGDSARVYARRSTIQDYCTYIRNLSLSDVEGKDGVGAVHQTTEVADASDRAFATSEKRLISKLRDSPWPKKLKRLTIRNMRGYEWE